MMSIKNLTHVKTVLIVIAGFIMVAHGLRMMMQGLFYPESYYPAPIPTALDFWFDWFILFFIGVIIFVWGVFEFYQLKKRQYAFSSNPPLMPT